MNTDLSLLQSLSQGLSEIKTTLSYLKDDVSELKRANEDRRTSIDTVAHSLREDARTTKEILRDEITCLTTKQNTLETEFKIAKWAITAILLVIIAYLVGRMLKVILPEFEARSHDALPTQNLK